MIHSWIAKMLPQEREHHVSHPIRRLTLPAEPWADKSVGHCAIGARFVETQFAIWSIEAGCSFEVADSLIAANRLRQCSGQAVVNSAQILATIRASVVSWPMPRLSTSDEAKLV
jgi:hypothetical protein